MMLRRIALIALAALIAVPAQAEVSLKNGNFFTGSKDIVYPGGFEPKIERVYNSKTSFKGMFGWGWGNEYEVYLTVEADGSVVVHEYGGGADNRFSPVKFNAKELGQAVQMIAAAAKKSGIIGSPEELAKYERKLKTNASFRNAEWEKFRHEGKLKPRYIKPGTYLHSNRFSYQYLVKEAKGYVRVFDNGRVEWFNNEGKLSKITDKNHNYIMLYYNHDGHLSKLVDNFNRKMFFTFNSSGLLQRIQGENGKEADYRYDALGELVWAKDVNGNVYTYQYDKARRHNMVEIGYPDHTTMQIGYYPRSKYENVRFVKDRDGTLTDYTYNIDSHDHGHYTVGVYVKTPVGQSHLKKGAVVHYKLISKSTYEYFNKHKSDGEQWTYKMITDIDGDRTETIYNECCGLPLLIKRGNEETSFEYDTKGHVIKKITPDEVTELSYDPKVDKVTLVKRYSKSSKKLMNWSQFQYDPKGNLIFARNSKGQGVRLFYDMNGRIKSMVDQKRRRIDFQYNENSKPIRITDPAVGTIDVSYTNSGQIKKVHSSAGRKIALQVTSAFQNLLDIIRPAGVTLSF